MIRKISLWSTQTRDVASYVANGWLSGERQVNIGSPARFDSSLRIKSDPTCFYSRYRNMAALILVDLQVDFLGQKEDRPPLIDPRPFKDLLPSVLREFTTRRRPVVWVRAVLFHFARPSSEVLSSLAAGPK